MVSRSNYPFLEEDHSTEKKGFLKKKITGGGGRGEKKKKAPRTGGAGMKRRKEIPFRAAYGAHHLKSEVGPPLKVTEEGTTGRVADRRKNVR